jgi:DNA adenine methylase
MQKERRRLMAYPGGKGNVYQYIVNQQPPHSFYGEPFLGLGAPIRNKRAAPDGQVGIDRDSQALAQFCDKVAIEEKTIPSLRLLHTNAMSWLARNIESLPKDALLYLDPTYMPSVIRTVMRYKYWLTDAEHADLLEMILSAGCRVQISGYDSLLYRRKLRAWRRIEFQAMTRGGTWATEVLWMNYKEPLELHDYDHLDFGKGFRKREQLRRKKTRLITKLANMPALERLMLMSAIQELKEENL